MTGAVSFKTLLKRPDAILEETREALLALTAFAEPKLPPMPELDLKPDPPPEPPKLLCSPAPPLAWAALLLGDALATRSAAT